MVTREQGARERLARAVGLVAAGFATGALVGGGRLPRVYDWTTEWVIDAPRGEVFEVMNHPEEQAKWWPSMVVERVREEPGGSRAITYRVIQAPSVRRFSPPFRITSVVTDVEPEKRVRAIVSGDLVGVLETLLFDRPEGGTRVVFHWYVRVRNPILNALGYVAEPMYRMSHDHVMREGETGLRAYCERAQLRDLAAVAVDPAAPERLSASE